jgi:hypothetical protein
MGSIRAVDPDLQHWLNWTPIWLLKFRMWCPFFIVSTNPNAFDGKKWNTGTREKIMDSKMEKSVKYTVRKKGEKNKPGVWGVNQFVNKINMKTPLKYNYRYRMWQMSDSLYCLQFICTEYGTLFFIEDRVSPVSGSGGAATLQLRREVLINIWRCFSPTWKCQCQHPLPTVTLTTTVLRLLESNSNLRTVYGKGSTGRW